MSRIYNISGTMEVSWETQVEASCREEALHLARSRAYDMQTKMLPLNEEEEIDVFDIDEDVE